MNYYLLLFLLPLISNCHLNKDQFERKIYVKTDLDLKCHFFQDRTSDTLKFNREIEIIENTLNDTIILGNSILSPKQTGKFKYTKLKNRRDVDLNLEYNYPPADRICLSNYGRSYAKGYLKIRFKRIVAN